MTQLKKDKLLSSSSAAAIGGIPAHKIEEELDRMIEENFTL
jgi:hypothetical protein